MGQLIANRLFWLSVLLIVVVYFVGVATDGTVFFNGIVSLLNTATGRKADGTFAGYPQ